MAKSKVKQKNVNNSPPFKRKIDDYTKELQKCYREGYIAGVNAAKKTSDCFGNKNATKLGFNNGYNGVKKQNSISKNQQKQYKAVKA